MITKKYSKAGFFYYLFAGFLFIAFPFQACAQSTPSELARMSVYELTHIKLSHAHIDEKTTDIERWHFGYHYRYAEFDVYLDGTDDVPISQVIFDGNPANRTNKNFTVVPTMITQQAHVFSLGYDIDAVSSLYVVLPYILQDTDHISIVPGFESFNMHTEGIGDVVLSYTRELWQWQAHEVSINAGISFPTGSIDEKGDTPRGPGDQQLPYTMQLGSGTFDLPISAQYSGRKGKWSWGAEVSGKIRFGENSRDYRLGNQFGASAWGSTRVLSWLEPSIKFDYRYSDRIHGADQELLVPGPFPFPAAIANPRFYGGHKAFAIFGVRIDPSDGLFQNHAIELLYAEPIYQSLNGIQIQEDYHFNISWKWDF